MTRRLPLLLAGLACLLAVGATGGVTSMTGERPVTVAVVQDDAYLGVEPVDHSLDPGRHDGVVLLELENRFATDLTSLDATVGGDGPTPPNHLSADGPAALPVGTTGGVTASIACDDGASQASTETWTVAVTASGEDVAVEFSRPVAVTCEPPATAAGNANSAE